MDQESINVIKWYPFKENATILQIGCNSTELLRELCNKMQKVTLIVNSETKKNQTLQRLSNSNQKIENNIEIIVIENLEEISKTKEQYDYVSLIGTVKEYQDYNGDNAKQILQTLIKTSKNLCKDDGKILLAIDNKYGMKFWTTLYSQKNFICNKNFAVSKTEINDILQKENLENYKYYYLLPDYKKTNVIFTDKYLPNVESITRDFTYGEEEFANFNEVEAFVEILKENQELFKFFANSYFVEITKKELKDNGIKFVSFTNIRKEEYRIITTIYNDRIEKTFCNDKARAHIEQIKNNIDIMNKIQIRTLDTYQNYKIISKYIENGKSYDKILLELLKENKNEEFFKVIENFKQEVTQKLKKVNYETIKDNNVFKKYNIECNEEQLKELHFVKYGLWDLIFQNTFYLDNKMYFYDQEWYEDNIPIEFIIYRTIAYFPSAHSYIPTMELYKTLCLDKYLELFKSLDSKLQEKIRNNEIWQKHNRTRTGQTLMDLYYNLQKEFDAYKNKYENVEKQKIFEEVEELKNRNNELKSNNELLENENNKLKSEISKLSGINNLIVNSKSWKITEPLRWLRKKF